MGKVKDAQFWESAKYNSWSFRQYYNRLTELHISMFEWKNLPESIDERFLELALFSDGMAVFFHDETLGYLGLRCMIAGDLNVYRIPKQRTAYSANGYHKQLDEKNSIVIFNNYLHTNSMLDVEMFSKRLYEIDRTIDVNVKAQKTPTLLTCEETQRLTLLNFYKQYDGNAPMIMTDKGFDPNAIKAVRTDAPYVADKLYELRTQLWNEALTYMGISNINFMKKERMIHDEVLRQQGGTIASRYSRLEMRRRACREINAMFGLNIWCDYRDDYREFDEIDVVNKDDPPIDIAKEGETVE